MEEIQNRAFKEWAVVCEAMKRGDQTVLIRKGGIREEDGIFRIEDPEFLLMPTYDHQTPRLLQPQFVPDLDRVLAEGHDPHSVRIDACAVVDGVFVLEDEDKLRALASEHIWNDEYIRMRLDFNPYDPLYVIMLRVYCLPEATVLPMRPAYGGCKSWVTLEQSLSTAGAEPAIADEEYKRRRAAVLDTIGHGAVYPCCLL